MVYVGDGIPVIILGIVKRCLCGVCWGVRVFGSLCEKGCECLGSVLEDGGVVEFCEKGGSCSRAATW